MQINLFLAFPGILSHWLLQVDIGHPLWMVVGLPGNEEGVDAIVTNGRGRLIKDFYQ